MVARALRRGCAPGINAAFNSGAKFTSVANANTLLLVPCDYMINRDLVMNTFPSTSSSLYMEKITYAL